MTNLAQLMASFAETVHSCWQNSTVECLVSIIKLTCLVHQKMGQRIQAQSTNLIKLGIMVSIINIASVVV
jgi:hypothetical protein